MKLPECLGQIEKVYGGVRLKSEYEDRLPQQQKFLKHSGSVLAAQLSVGADHRTNNLYIDGMTCSAVLLAPLRQTAGREDTDSGVMSGE